MKTFALRQNAYVDQSKNFENVYKFRSFIYLSNITSDLTHYKH